MRQVVKVDLSRPLDLDQYVSAQSDLPPLREANLVPVSSSRGPELVIIL